MGMEQHEASNYRTFELDNGQRITLRVSNHNASTSLFDRNGENDGVSIVITNNANKGIKNNGVAHIVEFFYRKSDLEHSQNAPLAAIVTSIDKLLTTGEYIDTTGLAEVDEVNARRFAIGENNVGTTAPFSAERGSVDVHSVADELQDKFGVEVEVVDSLDGVKNAQARMAIDAGINIKGWYDPKTGKVCTYAPNAESEQDVMATYAHEVVAHKGMRGLLGEDKYNELCERLGEALTPEQRELVREYIDMGKSDGVLGDEYIARIAEMLIDEKGDIKEPTTWEKVKGAVREFFRDVFGLELTDADIRYLLWRSGERLRRNKADVFTRAQDVVTGQQLGQQAETQRSSRLRFIGEKGAARADQSEEVTIRTDNLQVAQEMETAGKAAKNIKLATGWERGVDGSWRYEENDDGIKQLVDNYFAWEEGRMRKIDALNREWSRRVEEYDKACKSRRKYWREKSIKTGETNLWGEEEILTPLEKLKNEISALEDYRNRYIDESRKTKIKDLLPANSLLLTEYPELREVEFGIFSNLEEGIYGQLTHDPRTKSTVKIELKRTLSKSELYRTLAHEVQHAIQLIEGLATGSNPIRAGSFDRYREHAGEVEARNVSRRMDMSDEQRRSSLAGDTEDVARNNQIVSLMGSGNSLMTESERNETMSRVNYAFNTQLRSFAPETADKTIFKLGRPSDILIAAGVVDKEMKLYGSKLLKKIREHGLALREIKDLPLSIASPIAVFDNHRSGSNRAILTELRTVDGNILVTIEVGKGGDVDFNIVSSVFGKRGNSVVNWINKGYATYIDKEKALSYLHLSAPIAEATESQELALAAKVIQKFENPKTERENPPKDAHFNSSKQGDLFKSATDNVGTYDTNNDDIRFAIGKKRKDDMRKGLLNKLTNASEEQVEQTITEIEKLGEQSKVGRGACPLGGRPQGSPLQRSPHGRPHADGRRHGHADASRHGRGDPCGRPHGGETWARRRGISSGRATTRVAPTRTICYRPKKEKSLSLFCRCEPKKEGS